MNEKEIAEIRRHFRPDKSSITHIRGCYVNENGEIVSEFNQPLSTMSQEETEMILNILRRSLSGTLGKNLLDISFETQQVVDSEEHKLLMALRYSLDDHTAVQAFYSRVIQSVTLEGNYLILLACDKYDVPYRSADGEKQDDASADVYTYILCSVCPVKLTKPALKFSANENTFGHLNPDWVVSAPELGFLFPAFDDRSTNLYGALYYTRNIKENHPEFVEAIFRQQAPMPAAVQMETFQGILSETLDDDCVLDTVQAVQEQLCGMILEHRENKESEPLTLSKGEVKGVLKSCGVSDSHAAAFSMKYDEAFGVDVSLSPYNLVDTKQLEVRTPDVTIKVSPDRGDLVETRVIDGIKYILIRVEEGVEVNGININIS